MIKFKQCSIICRPQVVLNIFQIKVTFQLILKSKVILKYYWNSLRDILKGLWHWLKWFLHAPARRAGPASKLILCHVSCDIISSFQYIWNFDTLVIVFCLKQMDVLPQILPLELEMINSKITFLAAKQQLYILENQSLTDWLTPSLTVTNFFDL